MSNRKTRYAWGRSGLSPVQVAITKRVSKAFGERLRQAIEASGCSQEELAHAIGYQGAAISGWINGKSLPSLRDVMLLAHELGVEPAVLLAIPLAVLHGDATDQPDALPEPSPNGGGGDDLDDLAEAIEKVRRLKRALADL